MSIEPGRNLTRTEYCNARCPALACLIIGNPEHSEPRKPPAAAAWIRVGRSSGDEHIFFQME